MAELSRSTESKREVAEMLNEQTFDAGGVSINSVEGPPSGQPVVMLHGGTDRKVFGGSTRVYIIASEYGFFTVLTHTSRYMEREMSAIDQINKYCHQHRDDIESLVVLSTFAWSLPSKTAYNGEAFSIWRRVVEYVCIQNLQLGFGMQPKKAKAKWDGFRDLLQSFGSSGFLERDTYYEDAELMLGAIANFQSELRQKLKKSFSQPAILPVDQLRVAGLSLSYLSAKIEDWSKHDLPVDNVLRVPHYELERMARLFNRLYNRNLGLRSFRLSMPRNKLQVTRGLLDITRGFEELPIWKIGDFLVHSGLGFWCAHVTSTGNPSINLYVPPFLFEELKDHSSEWDLPTITQGDLKGLIEAEERRGRWMPDDSDDGDVLEIDIEESLIKNPGLIEQGLRWYNDAVPNQVDTKTVGVIDLLCRGTDDSVVVVELKRGRVQAEVVGQIQKYLVWAEEHLEDAHTVRGIIVGQSGDKGLDYAMKGSRFRIDTKFFQENPPIEENLKHCSECGQPNPNTARFCRDCGIQQYM